MSLLNFQKTVWAANIEQTMQKVLVATGVANTNYEGSLVNLGDKVRVIQVSDPTITAYTRDASITYEKLDDAALELIADQAYSFSFQVNDVDAVQQKPALMAQTTAKAAYGFADQVDTYLLGLYAQSGLQSYATGTTNWDINSLNVDDVLLELKEKATNAKWGNVGRYIIVPPWFSTKLILAGITVKTSNDALYDNGVVANRFGWDIIESNNVSMGTASTGANTRMIAGIRGETFSYGAAINNVEAMRLESYFSDGVRGLYVFGGKIMRPDKAMVVYADKAAESA